MTRPFNLMSLTFGLLLMMFTALTAVAEEYKAGKDYAVLEQAVRTRDSSKIEVVEVFWYGCSHCYHFEPLISKWKEQQQEDVDFWMSPAIWNTAMRVHAQAFFTAKALGVAEKLHAPLFTTLVVERKRLANQKQVGDLFADYGVDRKVFDKTFNSFGINSQVKQADARARSYKVSGTPEVIVNGKYRVSASMSGSQAEMLKVIDYLVAQERSLLAVN
jgi:thiol:disulfide interchange protein DsbA